MSNSSDRELESYKETEVIELVQDAVADLHRIADRLERFANEQMQLQKMHEERGET